MLRNIAVRSSALVLALLAGCSSSKSSESDETADGATALTAQELLETCVTTDVPDFAALLDVLQNLLDEDADLPQPQLDLLRLLIDGKVGFSLDVDQDGVDDIDGSFGFTDANGAPTIPLDAQTIQNIAAGGDVDLEAIIDNLPDGTTFTLDFALPNLPGAVLAGDTPPSGSISITLDEGEALNISGGGEFRSGECAFGFDFADIGNLDGGLDGFPIASLGFDLEVGTETLGGSIDLDGTNRALIRAVLDGDAPEFFELDLESGSLSPADR